MRAGLLLWMILLAGTASNGLAQSYARSPHEPEGDNREYLLDYVTNEYNRVWREVFDTRYNVFRMRVGSNNVSEWFIEEELKFATPLSERMQLRFYHSRLFRNSSESWGQNTFEFEARVFGRNYIGAFLTPRTIKAENSMGLVFENRQAPDHFWLVSIEVPDFLRNATHHFQDQNDSLLHVFTDRPLRYGLDVRQPFFERRMWLRLLGEYVPRFEIGDELTDTGERIYQEQSRASAIRGWVEYVGEPWLELRAQTALGVEGAWRKTVRLARTVAQATPNLFDRRTGGGKGEDAMALQPMEFEDEIFRRSEDDTLSAWSESRAWVQPYAWVPLNDRFTLRATLRFEERTIGLLDDNGNKATITNQYAVPLVGIRTGFGWRRAHVIDTGFDFEFRRRKVEQTVEMVPEGDVRRDHRYYLAYEYAWGEGKILRIMETIDLDYADWGDFFVHDHGFFQLLFDF